MAVKTPRDRPYLIVPRTRSESWSDDYNLNNTFALIGLLLIVPVMALFWGLREAGLDTWRECQAYINRRRGREQIHDRND